MDKVSDQAVNNERNFAMSMKGTQEDCCNPESIKIGLAVMTYCMVKLLCYSGTQA